MIEGTPRQETIHRPVNVLANWLGQVDNLGQQIPLQNLTNKSPKHPLDTSKSHPLEAMQINVQIATIALEVIRDRKYFSPDIEEKLTQAVGMGLTNNTWEGIRSPSQAVDILVKKQEQFLETGDSWQFGKVGVALNPQAQRAAFKLHALQELLEPLAIPGALHYEDEIADILTRVIAQKSEFKILNSLLGPVRSSVRWEDFLDGGENPKEYQWIKKVTGNSDLFPLQQTFDDILLTLSQGESNVTSGTIIQILEKKTFKSKGNPPLTEKDVEDPHKHNNKVELYLPLMGPGKVKIQYGGKGNIYTFRPDPNVIAALDLQKLGAQMINGNPVITYKGISYTAEDSSRVINIPVERGIAQFAIIRPGDVHDFANEGVTPASAYALTLGFPKEKGLSLESDFYPASFPTKN